MPQKIFVDQSIKFQGRANETSNIEGNPCRKKLCLYDDFTGITLDTERWNAYGDNGGTVALAGGQGGTVTLTTGATNADRGILTSPLIFLCAKNPVIEARIKVSSAAAIAVNFGFNDAVTEGNDVLAMELTAEALTNARSDDAAMFVFDTGSTYDYWHYGAVMATTEGTPHLVSMLCKITNGTGVLSGGSPQYLGPGTHTLTAQKVGTFNINLPEGCAGTLATGTMTVTSSTVSLVPGDQTVTTSGTVGTMTLICGQIPSTSWETLRVQLTPAGDAQFYRNGKCVGGLPACTTAAAPFCAFLGVLTRTTGAKVLTVDYVKAWQDR